MLLHFGSEFEGYTTGAAWEDFKVGFKFNSIFDRCAVVTNSNTMAKTSTFFGSFIPCTVESFKDNELDNARAWLDSGELGLNYNLDKKEGIIVLSIRSKLNSIMFENLSHIVDDYIKNKGQLNAIVIDLHDFYGWKDFGSFLKHLSFVKNHHQLIKKLAFVCDGIFPKLSASLAEHFVAANVQAFESDKLQDAVEWARIK